MISADSHAGEVVLAVLERQRVYHWRQRDCLLAETQSDQTDSLWETGAMSDPELSGIGLVF